MFSSVSQNWFKYPEKRFGELVVQVVGGVYGDTIVQDIERVLGGREGRREGGREKRKETEVCMCVSRVCMCVYLRLHVSWSALLGSNDDVRNSVSEVRGSPSIPLPHPVE